MLTRQFDPTPASISRRAGVRQHLPVRLRSYLTQPHSSDDDLVHSASVQDSRLGSGLGASSIGAPSKRFLYYAPPHGNFTSTSATWTSRALADAAGRHVVNGGR